MAERHAVVASLMVFACGCSGSSSPAPDLTAQSLVAAPNRIVPGSSTQVTFVLQNVGPGDAGSFTYQIVLGPSLSDGGATGAPVILSTQSVEELGHGVSETQSFNVTVPSGTPPGTYQLSVVVDPDNQIAEGNENNNVATAAEPLRVLARGSDVNLIPSEASITAGTVMPEDMVPVSYKLRNAGHDPVTTPTKTHFYLSTDSELSADDRKLGEQSVPSIGAAQTVELEATLTIPADVAAGNYTLLVVADGANALAETEENDNVTSVALKVQTGSVTGMDLTITALSLNPTSVPRGGGTTLTFVLKNRGDTAVETSFVNRVYLGRTQTPNAATDPLLLVTNVTRLGAGESITFEQPVVVPASTEPGVYYVWVSADPTNRVAESNENNNVRIDSSGLTVTPPAQSDLVAENVTLDGLDGGTTVAAGSTLTVNFALGNNGPDASGSISVNVVLSQDSSASSDDRVLDQVQVVNLASGQTQTFTRQVVLPTDIDNRRYFLGVVADPDQTVQDPNRANNVAFEPGGIQVTGGSGCTDDAFEPNDTRATAVAIPPGTHDLGICTGNEDWFKVSLPLGASLKVAMVSAVRPEPDFDLALYAPGSSGRLIDSSSGSGSTEEVSVDFVTEAGDYLIQVDPYRGSGAYTLTITVTPAGGDGIDLVPLNLSFTGTHADPGASVPVRFDVRNVGTVDSPDFNFEVKLLPADAVCPHPVSLGTYPTAALPSTQSRTINQSAAIPVGTCNGDYFVQVVIDPGNLVAETYEENNTVTTTSKFTVGGIGGCVDDALEPNDNRLQARVVGPGTYQNLKLCKEDDDWYALYVVQGEQIQVSINFDNAQGDLDLRLSHEDDSFIGSSTSSSSDTETVSYTATRTERIHIRVYGYFSSSQFGNGYSMTITGGAGVDLVVKNLAVTPVAQAPGENINLRFTVENLLPLASTATTAVVRLVSESTATTLQTVDVPALGSTTADGPSKTFDLKFALPGGLSPGLYDLQVEVDPGNTVREGSDANNTATLAGFRVMTACTPDAYEPNDAASEATLVPLDGGGRGALSNLSLCPSDVDFFRILVGPGGPRSLSAQITFSHAQGDLDLYLYRREASGTLTELARSTGNVDNETVQQTDLGEGTYLLKVVGFNGAANSAYDLSVTLTPP
jgi:subtilase family serine protease